MSKRLALIGIMAMVILSTPLFSGRASAACSASAESGTWINPNAVSKALVRIEVRTTCKSGKRGWKIRALIRCARAECTWGYADGVRRPDGALAALYSTFTAERLVRLTVEREFMAILVINIPRNGLEKSVNRYLFEREYD